MIALVLQQKIIDLRIQIRFVSLQDLCLYLSLTSPHPQNTQMPLSTASHSFSVYDVLALHYALGIQMFTGSHSKGKRER